MRERLARTKQEAHEGVHRRIDRVVPEPIQRFVGWLRSDDFFSTSSSLAYYAMISLAPMVLVALWIVGAFVPDETLENLGSDVEQSSPDQLPVGDIVRQLIEVATTIGFLSVLGALWPATAYGAALARAFSRITPDQERRVQGMQGRLFALVIVALMPLAVFGGLALFFVGPRLLPDAGAWLPIAFGVGAYAVVVAVVAVIFTLFRMTGTEPSDIVVGSLASATLMAVATGVYLVYLEFFADFEENYGASSLATTVLLGLWLMVVNAMMIVGYRLMLHKALHRDAERNPDGPISGDREEESAASRG
jgi:YihY family inner membrane protein